MKAINFVAGFGAVLMVSSLCAEGESQAELFSSLDKDNDGYVSINEADGQLEMLRHWVDIDFFLINEIPQNFLLSRYSPLE